MASINDPIFANLRNVAPNIVRDMVSMINLSPTLATQLATLQQNGRVSIEFGPSGSRTSDYNPQTGVITLPSLSGMTPSTALAIDGLVHSLTQAGDLVGALSHEVGHAFDTDYLNAGDPASNKVVTGLLGEGKAVMNNVTVAREILGNDSSQIIAVRAGDGTPISGRPLLRDLTDDSISQADKINLAAASYGLSKTSEPGNPNYIQYYNGVDATGKIVEISTNSDSRGTVTIRNPDGSVASTYESTKQYHLIDNNSPALVGPDGGSGTTTKMPQSSAVMGDISADLSYDGSDGVILLGSGSVLIDNGSGNVDSVGYGTVLTLAGTGDVVYGNSASVDVQGSIGVDLHGSNCKVTLSSRDSLGAYGGNNTINAQAGDLVFVNGTNSAFDAIYASGDAAGGTTATGQPTGIYLDYNAQANVYGSGNFINVGSGGTLGAYGGNNSINANVGDNVSVSGTNGAFDIIAGNGDAGGGLAANGQPTGIYLDYNTQANVNGSGNFVNVGSGGTLGAYGGNNTIDTNPGDLIVIGQTNAAFDIINGSGDAAGGYTDNGQMGTGISFNGDSQANVNGSGNTVFLGTDDTLGAYGGNNTIDTNAGDFVVVGQTNGAFDIINANGDAAGGYTDNGQLGTGIAFNGDAQANVNGAGNTVFLGTDDTLGAYGGNNTIDTNAGDLVVIGQTNGAFDIINANGDAAGGYTDNGQLGTGIAFNGDAQANVNGAGNTVFLGTDDTLGAYGGNNTIDTNAGDLVVVGQTNGAFDTINANGDAAGGYTDNGHMGTGIVLNNDAQANVFGSGNTESLNSDDTLGAYGGSNSINSNAGDLVVIGQTGGAYDTLNANGDATGGYTNNGQMGTGIVFNDSAQANVYGSSNSIQLQGRDTLDIQSGWYDDVTGSGDQIREEGNVNANIFGNGDTVTLNTGDSSGIYGGGNTINGGAGELIVVGQTGGNFDTINAAGDHSNGTTAAGQGTGVLLLNQAQANLNGNNDNVYLQGNDALYASNEIVSLGNYTNGDVVRGNNDGIYGDHDLFSVFGGGDTVNGNYDSVYSNEPTFNLFGGSGTGDSDDGGGWGGDDFDDFDLGLSSGSGPAPVAFDAIAAFDATHGYVPDASLSAAASADAQAAADGQRATSAATLGLDVNDQTWGKAAVTWSFAPGQVDAAEKATMEQAIGAWSGVSGIAITETDDPATSDIRVGWGNFDTGDTRQLGLTGADVVNGTLKSGSAIWIENPNETALAKNAAGDLVFYGTDATLYQVTLHEFGHALGLGDDSDPNSVMYYQLDTSNRGLDDTDRAALQRLYGAPPASMAGDLSGQDPHPDISQLVAATTMDPQHASVHA